MRPRPPRFCGAERLQRRALDEAVARDRHHHLAGLDQALVVLVGDRVDDVGHARARRVPLRAAISSLAHHLHARGRASRGCRADRAIRAATSPISSWILSRSSPVRRCSRSSRMPRACSSVRRTVPSGVMTLPGSSISASSAPISVGRPVALHQRGPRRRGVGARADQPDHLVDIGHRDREADQDVRPVARLDELEARRGGGSLPRGTR